MEYVKRKEYLDFLIRHKDKNIIKVISGVRRSGKSTLFEMYREYLLNNAIKKEQILHINFEDLEYEHLQEYKALYKYIKSITQTNLKYYIFLDEIQHVKNFEKVVDSLYIQENIDIYITGSNAYFMSGELATLLTGRYVELSILPLSFKEYCEGLKNENNFNKMSLIEKYNIYIQGGSFPYVLTIYNQPKDIREYLKGIYSSILLKDVVARYKISDVLMLESVIRFVFDNIGSLLSISKIANTMTSLGRKVDFKTVEKYIASLRDSLIIYQAKRYNIKGKALLASTEKYYVVDIGLRNSILGNTNSDQGHILENIVYLELIRRGYEVYVGKLQNGEIDFVAMSQKGIEYYQVAATVLEPLTLQRELSAFHQIKDQYPKYLLTFDQLGAGVSHNGIEQINVLEWLLDK